MEAEERLEERPAKKIKLGHSAHGEGYALAEEDTSVVVPRLQMCVEDRGEGCDHLGSTGANVTETNELDADVSENPVSEDNAEPEIPGEQTRSSPPLSKNALKKIRNKERWDAGRDARKLKRKQKIAEKRIRKRVAKEEAQAAAAAQAAEKEAYCKDKPKRPLYTRLPVSVIIDCGFDSLMTEREMISLGSQLTRSYSDNHKAPFQAHMFVSSWGGQLKQRFDTVLEKHHENWRGVTFMEEDFVAAAERAREVMKRKTTSKLAGAFEARRSDKISIGSSFESVAPKVEDGDMAVQEDLELGTPPPTVAISEEREDGGGEISAPAAKTNAEKQENGATIEPKLCASRTPEDSKQAAAAGPVQSSEGEARQEGEIVYLTSDSPHTLDRLQPYSTYIVGGLVDKNRHKGICYKIACARGIKTAKLPIGEFMEMQSRYVLATNHVVEIMVRWLECGDWGESFLKVMPKRKGGVLKAADGTKQDVHGPELGVEDSSPGSGSSGEREAHLHGGDELENGQRVHSVSNVS